MKKSREVEYIALGLTIGGFLFYMYPQESMKMLEFVFKAFAKEKKETCRRKEKERFSTLKST